MLISTRSTGKRELSSNRNNKISSLAKIYYSLKPAIPRTLQLSIRRKLAKYKLKKHSRTWPIDEAAGDPPRNWEGWPGQKNFALVLMHDVDTQAGHNKCRYLMDLEEKAGFRSTFNFVAEKYKVSDSLLGEVKARGFGIGVHGLKHDGKLFASRTRFLKRAKKINEYMTAWGTRGFSSPSMLRHLQWMHDLDIDYSTSTFDTDPFEPQPDGIRTIFPVWISNDQNGNGYLELPYTLPQDHLLFVMLKSNSIEIWRRKLEWIIQKGGMALLNTHPDYMNFGNRSYTNEEYSSKLYAEFLEFIKTNFHGEYFGAKPSEIAEFWHRKQFDKKVY